jgi:hypothetical protein
VQREGADPADPEAVAPLLHNLDLQLSSGPGGEQQVRINGHDVTEAIRSPEVTAQVSVVAAHGCVRDALTSQQQAMGHKGGLVAEGPTQENALDAAVEVARRLDKISGGIAAAVIDENNFPVFLEFGDQKWLEGVE